ncbi:MULTISPECIES: PEP-utilizing enzyme [unclassified Chryseobacterium]|uniref:PEP-utilizing enzyme n=1 Tax=unclassified Chryseobacterium TaxID=2593645 RepID=UPI0013FDDA74|nr:MULTISPECIES: PEP-utilizing enzyme [unclassified Chryseobacterium]
MINEFFGISAASGKTEGVVKWVLSEADLDSFQPGEVLFAKMTSPDWGNLFQKAAAVVTEQGGMLCHAAIVAREEGIPAVVGIGEDLSQISDGIKVLVDGDEGIVTVIESTYE